MNSDSSLQVALSGAVSPQRRGRSKQGGFTIVEVMMAAIVLAFSITTAITVMQRGFVSLDTARNITIAGQIMQSEFEKMRIEPWATIEAYPASTDPLAIDSSFTSNAFIGNRFTMRRDVTDIRTGLMRQVTLTISWTSYDGRTLSRSYSSYYGKNGLYDYFYNDYSS